jgi:DNA-binding SARP family transcriptional activator
MAKSDIAGDGRYDEPPANKKWPSRRHRAAFVVWTCLVMSCAWVTPAGASTVKESAVDSIEQNYRIPIANPQDGTTIPSMLVVGSATLDTVNTINSALAPRGFIFLTLRMSSGPVQRSYGDPLWGDFFSGLKPMPASALRYVAASGRSYVATRANPISQTFNPNGLSDDGLVDATYYFTVPITNRRGTLVISPTRTTGVEYHNFTGFAPVVLDVGGPTKVALVFPKKLTVTLPTPTTTSPVPGKTGGNEFNSLATLLAVILAGFAIRKRWRAKRDRRRTPDFNVATVPTPKPPVHDFVQQPTRRQQTVEPKVTEFAKSETTLRVDVLGPLSISPVNAPASDPVRAIVAYLAMNTGRLYTLEEIQNAVWPLTDVGTDIKKPAMRNYMVDARKTVGARHLPTASGRAGYQLCDFTTDWSEFQDLLTEAKKAPKESAVELRRRALDLAKGPPFTADTSRYFTWTLTSSVVYKMVEVVTTLAHELGTHYVLSGDLTIAQLVLRQGLETDPACLTLWEDLTDVLLETTDQSLLSLHWKAASLVLHANEVDALRGRVHG